MKRYGLILGVAAALVLGIPQAVMADSDTGRGNTVVSMASLSAGDELDADTVEKAGLDRFFTQVSASKVYKRMSGKSYPSDCTVPIGDLRYLRVLHYDFRGQIRVGELVCHKSISTDVLSIFKELYKNKYPIAKMTLVDDYNGDDEASANANNTSAFNYRTVPGSNSMSLHAYGYAIDINPLYNPYIMRKQDGTVVCSPSKGENYMDRTRSFAHKMDQNDLCVKLFTDAGFTWGGTWVNEPDYMHFSRGKRPE